VRSTCTRSPPWQWVLDDLEQRQVGRVIVDLSEVEFLALSGVQALITAASQVQTVRRQFVLVVHSRLRRVLELSGG
jgi:anti-anti-sigma factor